MVDIARDPRWGRIIEGAGEDPYLGSAVAVAQVRGFQGEALGSPDRIIAGPKHFAGYGAALGGRDYDEVNLSDAELWNVYLPPFKAVVAAGAGNIMTAYMDLNGVPATGNHWLLHDVLRQTWDFQGFVVSDAQAVHNLRTHGFAADLTDAAARRSRSGSIWRWHSPTPPTHTCRRRSRPAWLMSRRSTPRSVVSWPRRSGWGYSTSPSSTRTEHVRSSQTQPTAGWRGQLRSGRRCCCATRATCCP